MEYEIEDRPQLGDEDTPDLLPASYGFPAEPVPARRSEQRDRAVTIPEQEAGS